MQYLTDLFWTRWKREYLHLLQERHRWQNQQRSLVVGDLVLITDVNLPRNLWPLALEVVKDKYDNVRVCEVRTSRFKDSSISKFGYTILTRPISKLVLVKSKE